FKVNQPLPPAPTVTNLTETVAVGDVITSDAPIQLTVDNGTGVAPFTWVRQTSTSFPSGLDVSPTGAITGTVGGSAGTVTTKVDVTDAFLRKTTMKITWTVEPPLTITTLAPRADVVNATLSPSVTLGASGGDGAPFTWSVAAGTLPPGLSMTTAGVVSGKPTTVGVYNVQLTVTDKGGKRSTTGTLAWTIT